eukprot:5954777-Alexandrium_andersonii.AAC.1
MCIRDRTTRESSTPWQKRSADSNALNAILQEVSLGEAVFDYPLRALTRIPGVANIRADALSRLFGPEPKCIPSELLHVA